MFYFSSIQIMYIISNGTYSFKISTDLLNKVGCRYFSWITEILKQSDNIIWQLIYYITED